MVTEIRTLFTLGKGPVSRFNNQARIWVVDMTTKQQATLDLPKKLVRAGLLDEIQLFSTYSDVQVTVKSNNSNSSPSYIFQILSHLSSFQKRSFKNSGFLKL